MGQLKAANGGMVAPKTQLMHQLEITEISLFNCLLIWFNCISYWNNKNLILLINISL